MSPYIKKELINGLILSDAHLRMTCLRSFGKQVGKDANSAKG
jgi:hypothetical protein